MSKRKSPRQISVTGNFYSRLKVEAEVRNKSISRTVDDAVNTILDAEEAPAVDSATPQG